MGSLWETGKGLNRNMWNIVAKLFFPVFPPCVFIIGIPMEIRNHIIKRIVNREYHWQQGDETGV